MPAMCGVMSETEYVKDIAGGHNRNILPFSGQWRGRYVLLS